MVGTLSFSPTHNGKTQIWAIPEKGGLFRKARWEPTRVDRGAAELFPFPPQRWMERDYLHSVLSPVGNLDVSIRKPNSSSPIFPEYRQRMWTSPRTGNG